MPAQPRMLMDTATERVRELLRSEILRGAYPPGDRLKITDIAGRYGISPIPVREALRLLAGEGLVDMVPHRGAVVRSVDAVYICNMYDIRAALEAMLAERAIEKMKPADLKRIRAHAETYAKATTTNNLRAMLDGNAAFHGAINAVAENVEAEKVLGRGWELIRALRQSLGFTRERMAENVRQHAELVEALAAGSAARAAAVMREHCISGRDDLLMELSRR